MIFKILLKESFILILVNESLLTKKYWTKKYW